MLASTCLRRLLSRGKSSILLLNCNVVVGQWHPFSSPLLSTTWRKPCSSMQTYRAGSPSESARMRRHAASVVCRVDFAGFIFSKHLVSRPFRNPGHPPPPHQIIRLFPLICLDGCSPVTLAPVHSLTRAKPYLSRSSPLRRQATNDGHRNRLAQTAARGELREDGGRDALQTV